MSGRPAKRWIVRLLPLPDELMSSWLRRMAVANRQTNHSFTGLMFGREAQIWTRDLDRSFDPALLPVLAQWTGVPESRLKGLLLTEWVGKAVESVGGPFQCTWILPVGVYHRDRRSAGLQFCPHCLAERVPYARKLWRAAFATECLTHGVGLLDRCPSCERPFVFHRLVRDRRAQLTCICGHRFAHADAQTTSHSNLLRLQDRLARALASGYARMDHRWVNSLVLFGGIRHLLFILTSSKMTNLASLVVPRHLQPADMGYAVFERLPVCQRRGLMKAVSEWMLAWPRLFLDDVSRSQSLRAFLSRDQRHSINWIQQALDQCPTAQPHRLTAVEVTSCSLWLRSQGCEPTLESLADALGLSASDRMWPANRTLLNLAAKSPETLESGQTGNGEVPDPSA